VFFRPQQKRWWQFWDFPLKLRKKSGWEMRIIQLHNGICGNSLDVFFPWKVGLWWIFLSRTSLRFQHFQWFSMLEHVPALCIDFPYGFHWIFWIFQHFPAFSPQFPHIFHPKMFLQRRHLVAPGLHFGHLDDGLSLVLRLLMSREAVGNQRPDLLTCLMEMMGWWKDWMNMMTWWTYGWWNFTEDSRCEVIWLDDLFCDGYFETFWDLGSFLERWLRDGSGRSFFEAGFTSDGFVEAVECWSMSLESFSAFWGFEKNCSRHKETMKTMKTKKRKKRNAHEWIVCMYIYIIYIYIPGNPNVNVFRSYAVLLVMTCFHSRISNFACFFP